MKKIIALVCILFLTLENVMAAEYTIISDNVVEFSGEASANESVSVIVTKPGKDYTDVETAENKLDVFVAYKEYAADENGIYNVKFKLSPENAVSGLYTVRKSSEKNGTETDTLYYINKEKHELSCNEFMSSEEQRNYMLEHIFDLGLEYSLITETNSDKVLAIYNKSLDDGIQVSEDNLSQILNKCATIEAINDNKIPLISKYSENLDFSNEVKDFLSREYITDVNNLIDDKIAKSSKSVKEFDKNFNIALALACVQAADGYGVVKEVLTAFSDDLGVSEDKITDSVCKRIIGKSFTLNQLKIELERKKDTDHSGGGGGGGGHLSSDKKHFGGAHISNDLMKKPTPEPYEKPKESFTDLSDWKWAETAVYNLRDSGILNGKGNGRFCPGDAVLREEFVKMVMETMKFSDLYGDFDLQDVKKNDWYYSWVRNAYLAGIVNGTTVNTFGSGSDITRQDMAVIIFNAMEKKGIRPKQGEMLFKDKNNVSDYAEYAVSCLSGMGIIHGDQNGNFNPLNHATRAEASVMIYNMKKYVEGVSND